jgi:hypothetical protein
MGEEKLWGIVHCHIGSLEICIKTTWQSQNVHCHIGSLENAGQIAREEAKVHCHIGSLERHQPQ